MTRLKLSEMIAGFFNKRFFIVNSHELLYKSRVFCKSKMDSVTFFFQFEYFFEKKTI